MSTLTKNIEIDELVSDYMQGRYFRARTIDNVWHYQPSWDCDWSIIDESVIGWAYQHAAKVIWS